MYHVNAMPAYRAPLDPRDHALLGNEGANAVAEILALREGHAPTPLYGLPGLARELGLAALHVKDEGHRLGLGSFKALGGAYALHPAFGEAQIVEIGVDARPAFPDNLPRLTRRGRVIHVNGFYRHGFLLSPAMARLASDALLDPASIPERLHDVAA